MGDIKKMMSKHGVLVQRSEANNPRYQAFVERANRTLVEKLFSHKHSQEMIMEDRTRIWVKRLPVITKTLNSTPSRLTGKAPVKALELEKV